MARSRVDYLYHCAVAGEEGSGGDITREAQEINPNSRRHRKLVELYFNHRWKLPRAARACGISTKRAATIIAQAGYRLRGRMGGNRDDITAVDVAKHYCDGMTINRMSRLFGTTHGLIRTRLREAKVEMRPRKGADIATAQLIDLCIHQGLSAHEAGQRLRMHPSAICRRLKKAGHTLPKGNRRVKTVLKEMVSDYFDRNFNLQEVAKRAGVSLGTVENRFREAGIKLRTRTEGTSIALDRKREETTRNWRPADWYRKPIKWRIIGDYLRSQDSISNANLFSWLDSTQILKCPYADTWTDALNNKKCSENEMKRCSEFIRKIRGWVKKPGKSMVKKMAA